MFLTKGWMKVSLVVVGILVVAGGVYIFLIPTTIEAHNENDSPRHTHFETLARKWGFCGYPGSILFWSSGGWSYSEYCTVVYYSKARWQTHGVNPPPETPKCRCYPPGPDGCPCSRCYEQNCNYQN